MEQKKKIKIAIVVLAVLLGISLLALGGTLIYNHLAKSETAVVAVPDNLITPEEESTTDGSTASATEADTTQAAAAPAATTAVKDRSGPTAKTTAKTTAKSQSTGGKKQAATIDLYNKQPEENTPFQVGNMFPGDQETKYFRVQVSYHDTVTVHYKATVRPGYEKLAQVLKVKIKLLTTGETMYDGLMRDMPASLTHKLVSADSTTDELYYEITAYLDTSVGNAYQNQDLIADFSWWVEETGNLDPSPHTGNDRNLLPWICLVAVSGSVLIILLATRKRKEDEAHG